MEECATCGGVGLSSSNSFKIFKYLAEIFFREAGSVNPKRRRGRKIFSEKLHRKDGQNIFQRPELPEENPTEKETAQKQQHEHDQRAA